MFTLSACLRQSILLIFPFWSGFESTHMAGFFPVMDSTKSSLHSWAMSFRSFPNNRLAHFCFTSAFSALKNEFYNKGVEMSKFIIEVIHYCLYGKPMQNLVKFREFIWWESSCPFSYMGPNFENKSQIFTYIYIFRWG